MSKTWRTVRLVVLLGVLCLVGIPYGAVTLSGNRSVELAMNGTWHEVPLPVAFVHAERFSVRLLPISYGLVSFMDGAMPPDGTVLGGCVTTPVTHLVVIASPRWEGACSATPDPAGDTAPCPGYRLVPVRTGPTWRGAWM